MKDGKAKPVPLRSGAPKIVKNCRCVGLVVFRVTDGRRRGNDRDASFQDTLKALDVNGATDTTASAQVYELGGRPNSLPARACASHAFAMPSE